MGYRLRKDTARNSKSHGVRRHRASKEFAPASCLHNCFGGEGLKKVRRYIKKALEFGVESGYLIPSDSSYKVLRVSSDLISAGVERHKHRTCDRICPHERDRTPHRMPAKFGEVQDARRRRKRGRRRRGKRRSRSGSRRRRSRSRGRRRSAMKNPEEVAEEDEEDYDMENSNEKRNVHTDDVERTAKNVRPNAPDTEKNSLKRREDGSDVSMDDDETDDEEDKKRPSVTKS